MPAPTLVLLPGLDGTGDLFAPFVAQLRGIETVVVRYPGDRYLDVAAQAERAVATLNGRSDLILLGESYSGRVAIEVSRRIPNAIRGFVFTASFLSNPAPLPAWTAATLADALFRLPLPDAAVRAMLAGGDAPDTLVHEVQAAVRSVAPEVFAARVRDVLRSTPPDPRGVPRVPTLYLAGRADRLVATRSVQDFRDLGLDVEVATLDAPHLLLQRAPEATGERLAAFLAALPADPQFPSTI